MAQVIAGRYGFYPPDLITFWPHDVTIGEYTQIAAGARIVPDHPSAANRRLVANFTFFESVWPQVNYAPVTIGSDVWIGAYALILSGVRIGHGAIVGANSLVKKDVPPYAVVGGSPAKLLRYRFTPEQIEKLLEIRWWDWSNEKVMEALPKMLDVDTFIAWATEEAKSRELPGG